MLWARWRCGRPSPQPPQGQTVPSTLMEGTVLDAAGAAATGSVAVLADETDLRRGDQYTSRSGRAGVRPRATRRVRQPYWWRPIRAARWRACVRHDQGPSLRSAAHSLGRSAPEPAAAECDFHLGIRYTRIGQMHQSKLIDATFSYGVMNHAETTFSTAVSSRSRSGPWEVGGEAQISNSRSTTDTFDPPNGSFARYLRYRGGSSLARLNDAPEGLDGSCRCRPPVSAFGAPRGPGPAFDVEPNLRRHMSRIPWPATAVVAVLLAGCGSDGPSREIGGPLQPPRTDGVEIVGLPAKAGKVFTVANVVLLNRGDQAALIEAISPLEITGRPPALRFHLAGAGRVKTAAAGAEYRFPPTFLNQASIKSAIGARVAPRDAEAGREGALVLLGGQFEADKPQWSIGGLAIDYRTGTTKFRAIIRTDFRDATGSAPASPRRSATRTAPSRVRSTA